MAFYFALSDTIYCENIDQGMQLAMKDDKNRRRVVSKKKSGFAIFEKTGLMSGVQAKRGGFEVKGRTKKNQQSNSVKSTSIQSYEESRKALSERLGYYNEKIGSLEEKKNTIINDLEQMKKEKVMITNNIKEAEEEIGDLQENLNRNKDKTKNLRKI